MATGKSKPMVTMIAKPAGMISAGEAARRLGVTRTTILVWFADGKLRGWRNIINRRVSIYETEIARIVKEGSR